MRRLIRRSLLTGVLAALSVAAMGSGAASAAAPAWQLLVTTGPTHLPPTASEVQTVEVDATGGTFTLSLAGDTTVPLPFDVDSAVLRDAIEDLPSVGGAGGTVEVEAEDGLYYVRFRGSLAGTDVATMLADATSLTGGAEAVTIDTPTQGGDPGEGKLLVFPTNVGGAATAGPVTVQVGPLPPGIVTSNSPTGEGGWVCGPAGAGNSSATCTLATSVPALNAIHPVVVPLRVEASAAMEASVPVSIEGGGALVDPFGRDAVEAPLIVSEAPAEPGVQALWAESFDENGLPATQAGGHPNASATMFLVNTNISAIGDVVPAGDPRDVIVDLPPGFVGNPMVTARCPITRSSCFDPSTKIGEAKPMAGIFPPLITATEAPISSDTPPTGFAAQFSFKVVESLSTTVASLRSDEDFGVRVMAPNIVPYYNVYGAYVMLEGRPAPAGGKAFLTSPSGCATEAASAPGVTMRTNSWQSPSLFDAKAVTISPVADCDDPGLKFDPDFTFQPSSTSGSTPVATEAHLHVDQAGLLGFDDEGNLDPGVLAPPHLKDSVVTLPEGLNLNPSAANGLEACTTAQIGFKGNGYPMPNPTRFDMSTPRCPDASKIGTATVETPLLDEALNGTVYLAAQGDNPSDSLIAMYLVIDDEKTGITVKLPGKVVPDPKTGQLTATFENNPQLPFEDLTLKFRGGGPRSTLATPDVCGTYETKGSWTPWSAPESGPPSPTIDSFTVAGNCSPSKAQRPFDLGFSAGTTDPKAGKHSPFTLRITRPDGSQELDTVSATVPQGLLATLKGVEICSDAQIAKATSRSNPGDGTKEIADPSCLSSSQVGTTTIGAGVGSEPIYVKTGKAYLTGPYKGAPASLTFIVPAVAGPFDLGVQVVRTALNVDPKTAQVTAVSDRIPQILSGIPVQIRDVIVNVDRNGFILNPTNCEAMSVTAKVGGSNGAVSNLSNRFQVDGCKGLKFKPKLSLKLQGKTKRASYQRLTATLTAKPGEANISRTAVTFPHSIFLAQEHIRTVCTRVQFAADACPKGSIYGHAEAITPLLDGTISGPVYLRSSDNTLPDLVAALRGPDDQPIEVELSGRTDSKNQGIRNTFDIVPDAPVTKFTLQMFGGQKSLLVSSQNLCKGTHKASVRMSAHNGMRHDFRPALKVKCPKGKAKGK